MSFTCLPMRMFTDLRKSSGTHSTRMKGCRQRPRSGDSPPSPPPPTGQEKRYPTPTVPTPRKALQPGADDLRLPAIDPRIPRPAGWIPDGGPSARGGVPAIGGRCPDVCGPDPEPAATPERPSQFIGSQGIFRRTDGPGDLRGHRIKGSLQQLSDHPDHLARNRRVPRLGDQVPVYQIEPPAQEATPTREARIRCERIPTRR